MDNMTEAVAKERLIRDATALDSVMVALAPLITSAQAAYQLAQAALLAVQSQTGGIITDEFGPYSSVDTLLRKERFAGKGASVDFIKANPTCSESDAEAAWTTAALAATGLLALVVPVASYSALYRANLVASGLIPEATYEAQRAWIVATPRDVIMGA